MGQVIQFNKFCKVSERAHRARLESGLAMPKSASGNVRRFERTPRMRVVTTDTYQESAIPEVSVVVPTRGRPELLNRCLDALVRQTIDPKRYEIIVVDDRPSEATRNAVQAWETRSAARGVAIHYVPSIGPHGPAAARNKGWHVASGAIVAFTDDDTTPSADWLAASLEAFNAGADAIWGRIIMPIDGTPTEYERDAEGMETAEFATANCLCRKTVLERLGGFDEQFRLAWREGADFYFRLLRQQSDVRRVPEAVVVHPVRPARWGASLSQQKKILFDVLLFKKHPFLYRDKIRAKPRWDHYATVLALILLFGSAIAGAAAFAMLSGAAWLALTARFCTARLRGTAKTPSHILEIMVTSALIPPIAVFWRIVGMLRFHTLLA